MAIPRLLPGVLAWAFVSTVSLSGLASAQTSIGVVAAGEFSSRTVGSALDDVDPAVEALRERTNFSFRPGVGVLVERQFNALFAGSAQFAYRSAGYEYDLSGADAIDPFTASPRPFDGSATARFRFDFIALALGVSETWGSGLYRFYAEEYLVPMFSVSRSTGFSGDADFAGYQIPETLEANDFHLAVRGGVGVQRELPASLRLRVGVTANYHFTQTFDDVELREHLFGFGPEVSLVRVFGADGTPTGNPDEIYY